MTETKEFGWCFIGCGTLAKIVAEKLVKSGRHRIVSAYTRREENCKEFTDRFGGLLAKSAEEAMTAPGVDAVYVVTPHRSHYEYTKLALECGKPVLCEKAFTVNLKDAEELISLAREKKLYLAEAMWTWYSPIARQVKYWLDSGELGTITKCVADCRTDSQNYAPRVSDPAAAGGALLDMGVYAITYIYKLFGKPEKISCKGVLDKGIDWTEDVIMSYPQGDFLAISSIWDPGVPQTLTLEGTKGRILLTGVHYAGEVSLEKNDGSVMKLTADGSYLNEFDRVAEEIREGLTESRYVTHENTLDVMAMMDECRRQMELKYDFEK